MKALVATVLAVTLLAVACTTGASSDSVPEIDDGTRAELAARAFTRACMDVICAGAPIYAPDSTPDAVRDAILDLYTDEVQYLTDSQVEERTNADGRFADGGILISTGPVHGTESGDVVAVDVGLSRGFREYVGRTYLFVWDGTEWADTSPDAVDVTVTSSVS
jgi:hypothetical protein